jgi:predicted metal-dependent hydrolase
MIRYQVQRNARSRNLRLRITTKAEVIVSAPPRVPEHLISRFVQEYSDWITRHLSKIKAKQELVDDNQVLIFGKIYQKVIHNDHSGDVPVYITNQELHVHPVTSTKTSVDRTVTTFLKTTAQKYIVPRTKKLAEVMGMTYTSLTLRDQKTRWGSCSSTGALNFNWRLVQYPVPVIDYVIVHELAHRREMNHSARFWALVAKYDPEYQAHRRWLKKYGSTVE